MNNLRRWIAFLRHDVWSTDLRAQPALRRAGIGLLRVALHVGVQFSRSLVRMQAAGLTLVTLLALVPVAAVAFAVAGAVGYRARLDEEVREFAAGLPAHLQETVEHVRQLVLATNFGALGLAGTVLVLWSGLVLFTRVEQAFNRVFHVRRRRRWLRRLSDFVALLVLVPPLALGALLLSSLLGGVETIAALRQRAAFLSWIYEAGLGFVPHVMLWIAFTVLYRIMPSARVRWAAALAGGTVAGSAVVAMHRVYIVFQVGVAHANAIYATLAALPLLLVYLEVAWTIVLVGAEIAYAVQNLHSLRGVEELPPPGPGVRRRLAWHLVRRAGAAFRRGERGARGASLAADLQVPAEWVGAVGEDLLRAGLLLQAGDDGDLFVPARPPETIRPAAVLAAAEGTPGQGLDRVRLDTAAEQALAAAERRAGESLAAFSF